jgi:uncharacterized ParB-like nuclease family protein
MNSILSAVSVLTDTEPQPDAIGQLFDVAKKFKPLTPEPEMKPDEHEARFESEEPWEVELDRCGIDERYQRPLDREKVEAMRKDKTYERLPIKVNFDPAEQVSYWIIDGQHRAEAARQDGRKTVQALVHIMPSQEEQDHETGIMAKTFDVPALREGEDYVGIVSPEQHPDLVDVLTGMGGFSATTKLDHFAYNGRCVTVTVGKRTLTYVPHDAVEKTTMLAAPERGMLRFEGFTEAEVSKMLATLDVDVSPRPEVTDPEPQGAFAYEALGIPDDRAVEVLAEGIGGREWPHEWVIVGDDRIAVHNGAQMLADYPYVTREKTPEGWRLIGERADLTVRAGGPNFNPIP